MKRCLMLILLLPFINAHAALNKWVDANGKVHYSDTPPPDTEVTTLRSSSDARYQGDTAPAATASAPAAAKTIFEQEADINKAKKTRQEAEQKEAKKQEEAKLKQQNCEQSRNHLLTLQNAPRIRTYDANGEPTIMDDGARERATTEAQAAISKYCN